MGVKRGECEAGAKAIHRLTSFKEYDFLCWLILFWIYKYTHCLQSTSHVWFAAMKSASFNWRSDVYNRCKDPQSMISPLFTSPPNTLLNCVFRGLLVPWNRTWGIWSCYGKVEAGKSHSKWKPLHTRNFNLALDRPKILFQTGLKQLKTPNWTHRAGAQLKYILPWLCCQVRLGLWLGLGVRARFRTRVG